MPAAQLFERLGEQHVGHLVEQAGAFGDVQERAGQEYAGLPATESSASEIANDTSNADRTRAAASIAASESVAWKARMANSSPPRRATRSPSRMVPRSRRATSTSSRSPTWWPSVSLISLKW